MTFGQIVYGLSGNDSNEKMTVSEIIRLIEILRQEYAPTVEMTKQQARVFKLYYDSEKPFDKSEFECIDNYFMKSINEKDLMRAWLHPEIIKVVDE